MRWKKCKCTFCCLSIFYSNLDILDMHFSYQICWGLMLREDYRALGAIVVEPGRALLNNFNSEKLETCHHCCLDHLSKIFSSSELSQSLTWSLASGCYWQQRWEDSWEFWSSQSTRCDLCTFSRVEGFTRMPSPHGDAPGSLEKNTSELIDPSNPFVHKLHLGAVQVRSLYDWNANSRHSTCFPEPKKWPNKAQ